MTNRYDLQDTESTAPTSQRTRTRGELLRPALWGLLVVSAAANMVVSSAGLNEVFGIGFGLVTLGCGTALVVTPSTHRSR